MMKKNYALIVLFFTMSLSFGQTPTILWNYSMPDKVGQTTSPAIGTDGTVYIACSFGTRSAGITTPNFFAINPGPVSAGGGTLKWGTQIVERFGLLTENPDDITSTPSVHPDGSIYMGGIFGRAVFKLNPVNGSRTVLAGLGRQRQNGFAFAPDGSSVYTGFYNITSNRGIKSLKSDLSAKNWDFEIEKEFNLTPAVGEDGTIYAASITTATIDAIHPTADRYMYAINPDGNLKWAKPYCVGGAGYIASAIAIGPDGTIYLSAKLTATPDGVLKAYNPVDGSEKWSTTIAGANVERGGPAIGPDGTIYLGNAGGFMRSYNPLTGAQINTFTASGAIQVVPAIDNDGKIYFGTTTGNFYVLNSDLSPAYALLDLGDSIHSAAVIGADGTIYVASTTGTGVNSGKLYALQTTATGPAASHWPMYGKTALHTSNARHTWTGATSTDWSVKSNWDLAVPATGNDVAIPVGITNQPTIASNVTINSVLIGTGATLTVNEGKTLNVTSAIANSGHLILKSSIAGTANLLSGSSAANVTQERYLASNQRGWRMLSNPLSTTTFGTLATKSTTPITLGNNASGFYNSVTNTWTNTTDADNMVSQQAYKVFVRGITTEVTGLTYSLHPPSNATLSIKGTATNTAPATLNTTAGQFYLVANPYTAPVSLFSILGSSSNLSTTVSYYDPTVGSAGGTDLEIKKGGYTFSTITALAQGDANDVVLPPMGAIFVQASSAGTINIPKTAIFTSTPLQAGTYNHKIAKTKDTPANALKLVVSSGSVYYDALNLQFKAVGDAGTNVDFGKLPNTELDFYSINGSSNMAVSELELKDQIIPLGITSTIQKSYTLNVADNTIPSGFEAELIDNVLNTKTALTPGTNYNFTIDSTPVSQGNTRFAINLKTAGTLSVAANELDSKIKLWPNPAHNQFNILNSDTSDSSIEISNLNGQVIHRQKANPGATTSIQTNGWSAGVYFLKATNNGVQTIKKLIIQ
jgi:Secretion system C-terminal sorting domain/PQQ-like domain